MLLVPRSNGWLVVVEKLLRIRRSLPVAGNVDLTPFVSHLAIREANHTEALELVTVLCQEAS